MIELTDTTASEIAAAFVKDRIKAGSPAMGMVLTLIVVVGSSRVDLQACKLEYSIVSPK